MPRRDPKNAANPGRWKRYCLISAFGLVCIGLLFRRQEGPDDLLRKGLRSNRLEEKIQLLRRSVDAAGGDYPRAEIELCLALAKHKDWQSFNDRFRVLDLTEYTGPDLLVLARSCVEGRQWNAAEATLTAAQGTTHSREDYLVIYCGLLAGNHRVRDWLSSAEELTRLQPEKAQYWWQLASIHEQRQNTLAAIDVYQAAIRQSLPELEISRMRYRILDHSINVGDSAMAREQFHIVSKEVASDPRIDVYEARLCHLEGRPTEALIALERALRVLGDVPEALRLRGILYLELGKPDRAAADLTRVIRFLPEDEVAFFNLALAFKRMGQNQSDAATLSLAEEYHQRYLKIHEENLRKSERKATPTKQ